MIENLLDIIKKDIKQYGHQNTWLPDSISPPDINALKDSTHSSGSSNTKDTVLLRLNLWQKWLKKEATISVWKCEYGKVVVLHEGKKYIPPTSWIRIFRLLSPGKNVRVIWFATEDKRIAPEPYKDIGPINVNGGYAMKCDPNSIVIYRIEEATRVLIHELLHASCTDLKGFSEAQNEADTEAWAEIILCALKAEGSISSFRSWWRIQAFWAREQADSVAQFHNVKGENDYAWRYLVGRLHYFEKIGLPVPSTRILKNQVKSLRFTTTKLEG